ncbi:MAG: hypothetical protein ABEJ24_04570 [Candidatus Magasanikbacteria bacterium]
MDTELKRFKHGKKKYYYGRFICKERKDEICQDCSNKINEVPERVWHLHTKHFYITGVIHLYKDRLDGTCVYKYRAYRAEGEVPQKMINKVKNFESPVPVIERIKIFDDYQKKYRLELGNARRMRNEKIDPRSKYRNIKDQAPLRKWRNDVTEILNRIEDKKEFKNKNNILRELKRNKETVKKNKELNWGTDLKSEIFRQILAYHSTSIKDLPKDWLLTDKEIKKMEVLNFLKKHLFCSYQRNWTLAY